MFQFANFNIVTHSVYLSFYIVVNKNWKKMVKTNTVVPYQTTSEANNNEVRPSRPRTKTTVIRTHENVQCGSTQLMSSAKNNPNHPKKSTTTTQNPISMPKLIENSSHNSHSSNSNSSICKSSSSNSHNTNSNSTVSNRVYSKAALASKANGVQATNSSSSSTSGVGSQSHAMNTHSMVL